MTKLEQFLEKIRGKRIHVIGPAGAEGSTILEFLLIHDVPNITAHEHVFAAQFQKQFFHFHDWLTQEQKEVVFQKLHSANITFQFQENYLRDIAEEDIIFVPQAWFRYDFNQPLQKYFHPDHARKLEYQDRVYNLIQLYLDLFPGKTVGVTGSNGKSTTTALIGTILQQHLAQQKNRQLFWGGNDRKNPQPLSSLHTATADDVLLLEISNRHLAFQMGVSPHVAVMTNIVPNHLDDHSTFENYVQAKREIIRYQSDQDIAVLNQDDLTVRESAVYTRAQIHWFSLEQTVEQGAFLKDQKIWSATTEGSQVILPVAEIHLRGEHNLSNVLAAVAACSALGVKSTIMAEAIRSFHGLDYRLQPVATINEVAYVNDSAGCNPKNIPAAIRAFDTPLVVIAGGSRKVSLPDEFTDFAVAAKDSKVKKIILIGSVQKMMEKVLMQYGVDAAKIILAANLQEAVQIAQHSAVAGDTVLLAPGCESFGEFEDYRERGEKFNEYVKELH